LKKRGRTVGIIVARMGSTRVPGKSILDLNGIPTIERIIRNVQKVSMLDEVCVATSKLEADNPIAEISKKCGVRCIRGDSEMVLDRVYLAAKVTEAEVIVEVGGDCPFIGQDVLDEPIKKFHNSDYDYLCNYEPPTYPEGYDINIISIGALARANTLAVAPSQRVHPFSFLSFHRDYFKIGNFELQDIDLSRFHWSLDFPEDIIFIRAVLNKLKRGEGEVKISEVLNLIDSDKEIYDLHMNLIRPKVGHAFWNAPSILRDMNDDLLALVPIANTYVRDKNYSMASACYDEISNISSELKKCFLFKKENE
jgi:spore coat polysaccharide biosynthesis protein SpsF (cytidylyltransferase family)